MLLDPADGNLVLPLGGFGLGNEIGSSAASFSADGRLVLASFPYAGNHIALYDTASGEQRGLFEILTGALSSDGAFVAGFDPGRYTIYDATDPTGDQRSQPSLLAKQMGDLWTSNSTWMATQLISGDHDNVVRVRDIGNWDVLLEMRGHSAPIRHVRVSADGRYVAERWGRWRRAAVEP